MDTPPQSQPTLNHDNSTVHSLNANADSHVSGGLRWLVLGVFLMGISFCINFLLDDAGTSYVVVMYTLTTLGTACILKCMANIFG